jgi:hypothetical protein
MGGKAKTTGSATNAAKSAETKSVEDQAVSGATTGENKNVGAGGGLPHPNPSPEEEGLKGADNNKRLAFLEERVPLLHAAVFGLAGRFASDMELAPLNADEDAVDTDLRLINAIANLDATPGELAAIKRAEFAEAQLAEIDKLLTEYDGFEKQEDESSFDFVVRFIASHDCIIDQLKADIKAQRQIIDGERPAPTTADIDPGAALLARLVAGQAENFCGLPQGAALALMFADEGAVLDVPPRSVSLEEISREGERAVYDRRLVFSPAGPAHEVSFVWLVARDPLAEPADFDSACAVRCEVPGGLRVGGGAMAAIPAGHLVF